jgi:hypothetical protein
MANAMDVRRLALALEGTSEAPHFDRAAFRVARIYATLAADGRSVNLMLKPDEQEFKCLLAPEAFAPVPNAWGRNGATTVTLGKITVPELRAALEMAWRHAQPKSGARSGAKPKSKLKPTAQARPADLVARAKPQSRQPRRRSSR